MKVFMELDIVCGDGAVDFTTQCAEDIQTAIESIAPQHDVLNKVKGHISISHTNHAHKIWAIYYDNDGEHEGANLEEEEVKGGETYEKTFERNGKQIGLKRVKTITPNSRIIKSPMMPTKNALETAIVLKLTANPNIEIN